MEPETVLQQHKIRPTAMRLLIYQFLAKQKTAVALTDVETALTTLDRTTLYRTLKTFEEHQLVHKIDDGTGVAKYALGDADAEDDKNNDLHLHFRCSQCRETVCLTDYKIPPVSLPPGFKADKMNLVVKGVCDKCRLD